MIKKVIFKIYKSQKLDFLLSNILSTSRFNKLVSKNDVKKGKSFKTNKLKNTIWSKEEDKILLSLIVKNKRNKWIEISKNFINKSPTKCQLRYLKINPFIKKGRWNPDEDKKLNSLINDFGFSWTFISKFFKNRNPKQIRSRYINNLSKQKITNFGNKQTKDFTLSDLSDCDKENKFFKFSSENFFCIYKNMINANLKMNLNENV